MVNLRWLSSTGPVHVNLAPALLIERALARQEAILAHNGALVVYTGRHTGRAARDKYLVREALAEPVDWGSVNQPMEPEIFEHILGRVRIHLEGRDLFVFDGWACADPSFRMPVRVVAEKAWQALFAQCLLLRPLPGKETNVDPELTIVAAPELQLDPAEDGTRSETCIALSLERGLVLIAGTHYAGEIKKSVFTYLNYLMPQRGVFPMHCAANRGPDGDTALFFGLSGTGKTTLSADPQRRLIGDDEHGWSDAGIFNFEGGCYAKTIRLSRTGEPQIWDALRFGALLENVVLDRVTRQPNFDDDSITENTRAAYPIDYIPGLEPSGRGGHPRHVLFLTCDAFGVLPPLSKLTREQALYHFLSGYTAKVAGTEGGVSEPQATFSACFGAPFLPLSPTRYADMLKEKLDSHDAQVWLVNTGWIGGPYGRGKRISLTHTRRLVSAILHDELAKVAVRPDPVFGVNVPVNCPDVPDELLIPRQTWNDPQEYDAQARRLAELFRANFTKYEAGASPAIARAGPAV